MKKSVLIIICSVVILALIASGVFLFLTKDLDNTTDVAPTNVDGTWAVVGYAEYAPSNTWVHNDNDFVVIANGKFEYLRGNNSLLSADVKFKSLAKKYFDSEGHGAPYYDCELNFSNATGVASFPDNITVRYLSDNVIELVDEASYSEWRLVRLDGTKDNYKLPSNIQQQWLVAIKGHATCDFVISISDSEIDATQTQMNAVLAYTAVTPSQLNITGVGTAYVYQSTDGVLVMAVFNNTQLDIWQLKHK